MTCDRVHWDTVGDFDARELVGELGMTAYTRQWSDGQHRVWVAEGQGYEARERIREWCAAHEVEAVNVRVEPKVPFRDLDQVPQPLVPELISAALDWLYPRSHAIRSKVVADLELVDADDVRSMMYLFISDHLDRYDADREGRNGTLNLLAFLIGKLRTWPQDLTRTAFGRNVVSDRIALHRAVDGVAAGEHRSATEAERAEALRTTVTDLRKRRAGHRDPVEPAQLPVAHIGSPGRRRAGPVQVAVGRGRRGARHPHDRNAQLTRAIMAAVNDPASSAKRAQNPLALAAVYLSFWEDLSRPEVARELDVLPKTAAAAVNRVMDHVEQSDLM